MEFLHATLEGFDVHTGRSPAIVEYAVRLGGTEEAPIFEGYSFTYPYSEPQPGPASNAGFAPPRTRSHGEAMNFLAIRQMNIGASQLGVEKLPLAHINYSPQAPYHVVPTIRHGTSRGVRVFSMSLAWRPPPTAEKIYRELTPILREADAILVAWGADRRTDSGGRFIIKTGNIEKPAQNTPGTEFVTEPTSESAAIAIIGSQLASIWAVMEESAGRRVSSAELFALVEAHSSRPDGFGAVRFGLLDYESAILAAREWKSAVGE